MCREVKLKKILFHQLPDDHVLFKQINITSDNIYHNLLALHCVQSEHQAMLTVDVFNAMDNM